MVAITFTPYTYISSDVRSQYNEIMTIVKARCRKDDYNHPPQISVHLGNLKDPMIGYCEFRAGGFNVVFDEKSWKSANEDLKFQLMAHELTHCLFGLGHSDDSHNYMYYGLSELNTLTKKIATDQFEAVVDTECSK